LLNERELSCGDEYRLDCGWRRISILHSDVKQVI
jgi:hypothetical protein